MLRARLAEFSTAFAVALGVYPTLLKTKDPRTAGLMFAVFAWPAKNNGFADTEPQAITTATTINKDLRIITIRGVYAILRACLFRKKANQDAGWEKIVLQKAPKGNFQRLTKLTVSTCSS